MNNVDVCNRIEARGHRPKNLVQVRRVDVFVHDDRPFAVVGSGGAGRGHMQDIARVTGIALADLNSGEARGRSALMIPNPEYFRKPASLERLPNLRGSRNPF